MRNVAIGVAIILALIISAYVLADREAVPGPGPGPSPTPTSTHSCAPRGTCRNGETCPAGTECSGLPAYGCYPVGCPAPICLASDTRIATPDGEVLVTALREGMLVWSRDGAGHRIAAPVVRVSRAAVRPSHRVIHLIMEDGREAWISPGHPVADSGRIRSSELVSYGDDATYDLLPASETGYYWANGILMGSTLK